MSGLESDGTGRWRPVGAEDQELIDAILRQGSDALRRAGHETRDPKFPFAMHHERMRSKVGKRRKARHSEVAELLHEWAASRPGFPERYAWQAVMGAADHLSRGDVPDILEPSAAWRDGPTFVEWAKARQAS